MVSIKVKVFIYAKRTAELRRRGRDDENGLQPACCEEQLILLVPGSDGNVGIDGALLKRYTPPPPKKKTTGGTWILVERKKKSGQWNWFVISLSRPISRVRYIPEYTF